MAIMDESFEETRVMDLSDKDFKSLLSDVLQTNEEEVEVVPDDFSVGINDLNRKVGYISDELEEDDIQHDRTTNVFEDVRDILIDIRTALTTKEQKDVTVDKDDDDSGGGILGTIISGITGAFAFAAGAAFTRIKGLLSGAFGGVISRITKILTGIKNTILKPFTFLKNTKIFEAFAKPFKFIFSKIGAIFKPITKLMPAVAKGSKLLKGIPIVGTVITAIFGIFDAFKGWADADEISGKSKDALTVGDKVLASISNVIDGFLFFLDWIPGVNIEASDIFKLFENTFSLFRDGIFEFLTNPIQKIKSFISFIFSKGSSIFNWFDSIIEDNKEVLNDMGNAVIGFIQDPIGSIQDVFTWLTQKVVGIFNDIVNTIKNFSISDMLPDSVKDSKIFKSISGIFSDDSGSGEIDNKIEIPKPSINNIVEGQPVNNILRNNVIESPVNKTVSRNTPREKQPKEVLIQRETKIIERNKDNKPIVIQQPPQKSSPEKTRAVLQIDDMGLGLLNSAMVE